MDPTVKDENQKLTPPTPSVGLGSKEAGRIAQVEDLLRHSETTPTLEPGVEGAGVEINAEQPELSDQDKKAGLSLSGEAIVPALQPTGIVQLPDRPAAAVSKSPNEVSAWFSKLSEKVRKWLENKKQEVLASS